MKRIKLYSKRSSFSFQLPKLILATAFFFALSLSTTVDARNGGGRHGGGGGRSVSSGVSMGRSSGSVGISRSPARVMSSRSVVNRGSAYRRGSDYHRGYGINRAYPYWGYPYFPYWGGFYWGISPYALEFMYNDMNYYDNDGIYYRSEDGKYQVVAAPVGYRVKTLPKGSSQFTVDGVPYFYYFGTYYTPSEGQYEVVEPPVGAMVESIPQGYEKLEIQGQTYYILNGVQYKAVMQDNEVWYQVIKNNGNNNVPAYTSKDITPMPVDSLEHK